MTIENAKYMKDIMKDEVTAINCVWDGQYLSVPITVGNRHYDEIKRQVDAGELTIADAD